MVDHWGAVQFFQPFSAGDISHQHWAWEYLKTWNTYCIKHLARYQGYGLKVSLGIQKCKCAGIWSLDKASSQRSLTGLDSASSKGYREGIAQTLEIWILQLVVWGLLKTRAGKKPRQSSFQWLWVIREPLKEALPSYRGGRLDRLPPYLEASLFRSALASKLYQLEQVGKLVLGMT